MNNCPNCGNQATAVKSQTPTGGQGGGTIGYIKIGCKICGIYTKKYDDWGINGRERALEKATEDWNSLKKEDIGTKTVFFIKSQETKK